MMKITLVTYDGPPVITVDENDRASMPGLVTAAYPLFDRRAILDERAAVRDAIVEAARPRSRLGPIALMLAAIAPAGASAFSRRRAVDGEDDTVMGALTPRRIAAARAAEAPPAVRPAGEGDPARKQQRNQRKQRRAQAKRRGFR